MNANDGSLPPPPPGGRLYSRPTNLPFDVVAPQHDTIHGELERWARWNTERYDVATECNSVESLYSRGGDGTPPATAHNIDPIFINIERMLIKMPEEYRLALRLFYIDKKTPSFICRFLVLRKQAFQPLMFTARAMLINLLRRHGLGDHS